jgi:hypothetical protein
MAEKKFILSEEILVAIAQYLQTRPWKEVNSLLTALSNHAKEYKEAPAAESEAPKTPEPTQ